MVAEDGQGCTGVRLAMPHLLTYERRYVGALGLIGPTADSLGAFHRLVDGLYHRSST